MMEKISLNDMDHDDSKGYGIGQNKGLSNG